MAEMYTPQKGEPGYTGTNLLTGLPMASYSVPDPNYKTPQQLAAEERAAQDKLRQEEDARIQAANQAQMAANLKRAQAPATTAAPAPVRPTPAPITTAPAPPTAGAPMPGILGGDGQAKVVIPPPTTAASDALAGLGQQGVPLQEGNPAGTTVQAQSAARGLRQLGQRNYPQNSSALAGLQRIY